MVAKPLPRSIHTDADNNSVATRQSWPTTSIRNRETRDPQPSATQPATGCTSSDKGGRCAACPPNTPKRRADTRDVGPECRSYCSSQSIKSRQGLRPAHARLFGSLTNRRDFDDRQSATIDDDGSAVAKYAFDNLGEVRLGLEDSDPFNFHDVIHLVPQPATVVVPRKVSLVGNTSPGN
jgi:hypothetical protein